VDRFGGYTVGIKLDNGGDNSPEATFINRGAAGGLMRIRGGVNMETEGEIACDEGIASDAHLLPCAGGVPHPVNGGGGVTAG